MKACVPKKSASDDNIASFSMKETLFFLMRKLQDKESQVSAMKLMISERDEKIAHLETYVGALLEKMRQLEESNFLGLSKKTINRGSQTKLDEVNSRKSWYGNKPSSDIIRNEQATNPYATLPRNKMGRQRNIYGSRGNYLLEERPTHRSYSKATQTLPSIDPTSSVQLFTTKFLRNELYTVSEELRLLEKRIHDIVYVKEQCIHNSEELIKTCQLHLKTQTARWKEIPYNSERNVPNYSPNSNPYKVDQGYIGEDTEADGMQRLEENIRLLQQEIKYRRSELSIVEENIDDLVEVCDTIRGADRRIQEALEKEALHKESAMSMKDQLNLKMEETRPEPDRIRPFSHFVDLNESIMSDDGDV